MNNLTAENANSSRLTRPRKSVIGKLERSSFQAQRLSDVGIAFSQQITAKVGLKLPASQERIVEQTRWLYLRYVFVKLRHNKLPLKDLNLTKGSRSRRAAALAGGGGGGNAAASWAYGAAGSGDSGDGPASPIVVSISEPSSADAMAPSLVGEDRPLFARQPGLQRRQSSIFMNVDLNSADLSLLSARSSSRRKNQRLGAGLVMPPENMPLVVPRLGAQNGDDVSGEHEADDDYDDRDTSTRTSCHQSYGPHQAPPLLGGGRNSNNDNNNINSKDARLAQTASSRFALNFISDPKQVLFGRSNSVVAAALQQIAPPLPPLSAMSRCLAAANASGSSSQAPASRRLVMDPTINNQILTVIMDMINNELRESKPEFYNDTIYEVIGLDKFSSLESLLDVQRTICQEMTRVDISWDRIVALFSLFGAMSLDCVRLGAPEHVGPILDGFIGFVERDLALWISQQGGWESFLYRHRADCRYGHLYKAAAVALPVLLALLFAYS